jgi:excinuclease ABC subunit B
MSMNKFKLHSPFKPTGDQPMAIQKLVEGYSKYNQQTLLGVTGSGKTFTMAGVIEKLQKPTLVLAHNKTLAAQLYNEFKLFFPENKVCYFISYYDYYQPESYLPISDTYIEKDSSVNEKIEQMRLETASALIEREDVIVVSSVSCIYGFGSPENFNEQTFRLTVGQKIEREDFMQTLITLHYERNDLEIGAGQFQVRGEMINFISGDGRTRYRVEFGGERIEKISMAEASDFKNKFVLVEDLFIFPANPFVFNQEQSQKAMKSIEAELEETLKKISDPIVSHRLKQRTNYDLEMIKELGFCNGIENYSRHFDGRNPGEKAYTLLDYFKYNPTKNNKERDFLFFIDESHVALPQVHGMYGGDFSRKKNLVDYGFRLPSAFDNRPLKFEEFEKYLEHTIYVSATPGDYELENSKQIAEQIIRPTGVVDPMVEIRPITGQIEDLLKEIEKTIQKGNRILITTLTKRMAEDLTDYLLQQTIKAKYLHSEIKTIERTEIIRDLRLGEFDVLVGINLLREGLDLPEVGFVAIMDADKEGFLRNEKSLIQTIGRAARNVDSHVVLYADIETGSIKRAIKETDRRRNIQLAYNEKHNIIPQNIKREIENKMVRATEELAEGEKRYQKVKGVKDIKMIIIELETQMRISAEEMDFEKAIELREELKKLRGEWGL